MIKEYFEHHWVSQCFGTCDSQFECLKFLVLMFVTLMFPFFLLNCDPGEMQVCT
jgi:hypothetical protein